MTGKRLKKGEMARTLVCLCVGALFITLVWAEVVTTVATMWGEMADLSATLTFSASVFGGELLLLRLKRLFAKNIEEETT